MSTEWAKDTVVLDLQSGCFGEVQGTQGEETVNVLLEDEKSPMPISKESLGSMSERRESCMGWNPFLTHDSTLLSAIRTLAKRCWMLFSGLRRDFNYKIQQQNKQIQDLNDKMEALKDQLEKLEKDKGAAILHQFDPRTAA